MTGRTRSKATSDPWWDFDSPVAPKAPASPGSRMSRRKKAHRHAGPLTRLARYAASSQRARRIAWFGSIGAAVAVVVIGALGVITLNNLVIKRSAELGRLDDSRREFRTKNALLSAKIAKLGAPPRIVRIAKKRFGMQPTVQVATFIYLDPPATPVRPQQNPNNLPTADPGSKAAANAEAFGQRPLQADIPNPFKAN